MIKLTNITRLPVHISLDTPLEINREKVSSLHIASGKYADNLPQAVLQHRMVSALLNSNRIKFDEDGKPDPGSVFSTEEIPVKTETVAKPKKRNTTARKQRGNAKKDQEKGKDKDKTTQEETDKDETTQENPDGNENNPDMDLSEDKV